MVLDDETVKKMVEMTTSINDIAKSISMSSAENRAVFSNLGGGLADIGNYVREHRADNEERPLKEHYQRGLVKHNSTMPEELQVSRSCLRVMKNGIKHRDFGKMASLIMESKTQEEAMCCITALAVSGVKEDGTIDSEAPPELSAKTLSSFITKCMSYRTKLELKNFNKSICEAFKVSRGVCDPVDKIYYKGLKDDLEESLLQRLEVQFLLYENIQQTKSDLQKQLKDLAANGNNGGGKGKGKFGKKGGIKGDFKGYPYTGGAQPVKICFRHLEGACNYKGPTCFFGLHPSTREELTPQQFSSLRSKHAFLRNVSYGSWLGQGNNNSNTNNDENGNSTGTNNTSSTNSTKGKGKGGQGGGNNNNE